MKRVLDSCVILKWLLMDRPEEGQVEVAMDLFSRAKNGSDKIIQPTHWRAEVLSVIARAEPKLIDTAVDMLEVLAFPVVDNWSVYKRAAKLSVDLNHHLFDTLYHAVALENGAELVTADLKYYSKAKHLGSIILLG